MASTRRMNLSVDACRHRIGTEASDWHTVIFPMSRYHMQLKAQRVLKNLDVRTGSNALTELLQFCHVDCHEPGSRGAC